MGLFQLLLKLTIQFIVKLGCVGAIRDGIGVIRFPSRLHLFHWKQYFLYFPVEASFVSLETVLVYFPVEASVAPSGAEFVWCVSRQDFPCSVEDGICVMCVPSRLYCDVFPSSIFLTFLQASSGRDQTRPAEAISE